ncbi:hypothetical protein D3C80_1117270 [compost metagenome]
MGECRAVPALVAVEHLQRFGLAHLVAPVTIDHQVERCAIEKGTRMLDPFGIGTFQYPQIGIVRDVFGSLTTAQARGEEAHQFAIVMFHDVT